VNGMGLLGILENVYGYSVDYPEDRAEGFQVTVTVGEERVWATVRVEQVGYQRMGL